MRFSTLIGILFLACLAVSDFADAAELSWNLPTSKANGEPIAAGELSAITVYAGTERVVSLPGTSTKYAVPSCTARAYTVTASIGDFESEHSNSAAVVPIASACRPQPPSGAGIAASP